MMLAGEPNGVAGVKGVVFTLAGVTGCPVGSTDPCPSPVRGFVNDDSISMALLTNQTTNKVQKIGIDIRTRMGIENGKTSSRIKEASEPSHANDLVLNSR